jgi:hypothetical protein
MNRATAECPRNCRNPLISCRVRRQIMAERLSQQWSEIRLYATIERDSIKLSRLAAELDKRKRQESSPMMIVPPLQVGDRKS